MVPGSPSSCWAGAPLCRYRVLIRSQVRFDSFCAITHLSLNQRFRTVIPLAPTSSVGMLLTGTSCQSLKNCSRMFSSPPAQLIRQLSERVPQASPGPQRGVQAGLRLLLPGPSLPGSLTSPSCPQRLPLRPTPPVGCGVLPPASGFLRHAWRPCAVAFADTPTSTLLPCPAGASHRRRSGCPSLLPELVRVLDSRPAPDAGGPPVSPFRPLLRSPWPPRSLAWCRSSFLDSLLPCPSSL